MSAHISQGDLDDVVILGISFDDHLQKLCLVLQRFKDHNLKLKPKKCHIIQTDVDFLGRKVSANEMSIQQEKIRVVLDWPMPTTKKELASFLGTVKYHSEFIPNYATLSHPLYKQLHLKTLFQWTHAEQSSFEIVFFF